MYNFNTPKIWNFEKLSEHPNGLKRQWVGYVIYTYYEKTKMLLTQVESQKEELKQAT